MSSSDFLDDIQSLIANAAGKKVKSTEDVNVTFNMRVPESLRNDFDALCKDNHTNMSREVKRYMRLAVANQKL